LTRCISCGRGGKDEKINEIRGFMLEKEKWIQVTK